MIRTALSLFALLAFSSAAASLPKYEIINSNSPVSSYGSITRLAVDSENLDGKVIVDVWTPAGYDSSSANRYPVIYAHDGQNLFDASFSFAGVPWGIDKACFHLKSDPDFVMPIIVGINNRGAEGLRPSDYFPEKALDYISPEQKSNTFIYDTCDDLFLGNEEAAFVAKELKPLVDSLYNTDPGISSTFAMGSSTGALASIYLLCEYPEIFGGIACMSTHWIGSLNLNPDYTMNTDDVCANAILQYLNDHLPFDGLHRIYMDQGTIGWDSGYLEYEAIAREIVRNKGYNEETGSLCVYDAEGAGHNEWYWQQRVRIPLGFLLLREAIDKSGMDGLSVSTEISTSVNYIFDLTGKRYPSSAFERLPAGIYIQNRRLINKK